MALPLEDYALLSDARGSALVGRDGSVDWLCLPRFDSGSVCTALLGDTQNGRWLLAPTSGGTCTRWAYREDTLILDSTWEGTGGQVEVTDLMPRFGEHSDLVRQVRGVAGSVEMRLELRLRFDDGHLRPWVQQLGDGRTTFLAGPDGFCLDSSVPVTVDDTTATATFRVAAGQQLTFVLTHHLSYRAPPRRINADHAVSETETWWQDWAKESTYTGPYRDAVQRSLVALKGLTYEPTGGIVAAPTMSLPEQLGGVRNWDYRFTWVRDATITLLAFLSCGLTEEAQAWRQWLLRAVAGDPDKLQIMYSVDGSRQLAERELDWLSGYSGARPVRAGNQAAGQLQLDVYGEISDALHHSRRHRLEDRTAGNGTGIAPAWELETQLLEFLEGNWQRPDSGIWEMRGDLEHHTYSKVMAWVALDRAIKSIEQFGLPGPLERWQAVRQEIHTEVCERAWDSAQNTFTAAYGSSALDASSLQLPLVGFLPADDPRVTGTVDAIEQQLSREGFVLRYDTSKRHDGLPPGEGAFLACTLWLAQVQLMQGRTREGTESFERVLAIRTDLGLLSEEYDVGAHRLVGNFPQAFSHVPLINTAVALSDHRHPRSED